MSMRAALAAAARARGSRCWLARPPRAPKPSRPRAPSPSATRSGVVDAHRLLRHRLRGLAAASSTRLDELGVRHLREGVYANPAPQLARLERALLPRGRARRRARHPLHLRHQPAGQRAPARSTSSWRVVGRPPAQRRRGARGAQRVRQVRRRPALAGRCSPPTARDLYRKAKATRALRGRCRSSARPSRRPTGPRRVGDQRTLARRRQHPPLHGRAVPRPARTCAPSCAAPASPPARKPVWATEAGFHNALRAPERRAAAGLRARPAPSTCCARSSSTSTTASAAPTLYELLDEKPDPRGRDAEQHFGLLRNDFSRKPAFNALRNLLDVVGRDDRRPSLRRCGSASRRAPATCAGWCCRRPTAPTSSRSGAWPASGTATARRPLGVSPRSVKVELPGARPRMTWPTRSPRPRSAGCACAAAPCASRSAPGRCCYTFRGVNATGLRRCD